MSIFEHHRFEIWNQSQHPFKHDVSDFTYSNPALSGVSNLSGALDYILATLYPNTKAAVANPAALPSVGNTLNDYRVVLDDGDGKAAGYRWVQYEGESVAAWHKIYDVDFGAGTYLAQAYENYHDLFVQKFGNDDLDAAGVAITGTFSGQTISGGKSANTNLTLRANSGDGTGAHTGFVQVDDHFAPTTTAIYDVGTSSIKFRAGYFSGLLTTGSHTVTDSTVPANGMYLSAANTLSLSSNSTLALSIDAAQNLLTANQLRVLSGTALGSSLLYVGSAVEALRNSANMRGIRIDDTYNSTSTGDYAGLLVNVRSDNASFTNALQASINIVNRAKGAASTITRHVGILSSMPTQGTNNANLCDNSSFTGNYILHFSSTNPSVISGNLGVGAANGTDRVMRIGGTTLTTGVSQYGLVLDYTVDATATSSIIGVTSNARTPNTAFTCQFMACFYADTGTRGAASTISRFQNYRAIESTVGSSNAMFTDNASYNGNYAIHLSSTNPSVLGGSLSVAGNVGFNGQTPAARQAYTASNVSTTRSYDASSTTLTTIANTLGTLIADLRAIGLVS